MVSGTPTPVKAPAETLARMASAVGVQSFQLRAAGREDAALELQLLEAQGKYGHLSTDEKLSRLEEITGQINKAIQIERLDPSSHMFSQVSRWVRGLAETIVDFESDDAKR